MQPTPAATVAHAALVALWLQLLGDDHMVVRWLLGLGRSCELERVLIPSWRIAPSLVDQGDFLLSPSEGLDEAWLMTLRALSSRFANEMAGGAVTVRLLSLLAGAASERGAINGASWHGVAVLLIVSPSAPTAGTALELERLLSPTEAVDGPGR